MLQVPLNEDTLAREALKRISGEKSVVHRAVDVLELIVHNSVGLGEVLQDYAAQASGQLKGVIRAAENVSHGTPKAGDAEALSSIHFTLKTVKSVLELTPVAMQRNKADALGEKGKLSRADISEITHAFINSSDVARLLAAEDSGAAFAGLALAGEAAQPAVAPEQAPAYATAH